MLALRPQKHWPWRPLALCFGVVDNRHGMPIVYIFEPSRLQHRSHCSSLTVLL